MKGPSVIAHHTSSADVALGGTRFVRSFTLTASNAIATAQLRAGGSNGTILASLCAASNTSVTAELHDAQFVDGVGVTISGTGAAVTIVYV